MMGLDNPLHLVFLLAILLLVFGAKRLPEVGRSLGAGVRGFKESITAPRLPEAPAPAVSQQLAPAPAQSAGARRAD
jgi:sec-independent protein translocase protein TatA